MMWGTVDKNDTFEYVHTKNIDRTIVAPRKYNASPPHNRRAAHALTSIFWGLPYSATASSKSSSSSERSNGSGQLPHEMGQFAVCKGRNKITNIREVIERRSKILCKTSSAHLLISHGRHTKNITHTTILEYMTISALSLSHSPSM